MIKTSKFFFTLACCFTSTVCAREPYHARVTVDTESAVVTDPNLVDLNRSLSSQSIQDLIPLYTPTSAVSIDINLRGLITLTSFASNSTVLVVVLPDAGITETFDGGTRDQSIALFKEYIQNSGVKRRLLHAYTRYSPIDPIAGNPDSLMSQMAQADYLLGKLSPLAGCDCGWSAQPVVHQFQAGMNYSRGFSEGFETSAVHLPLRYSYSPCLTWALILDAPVTYISNGGASSLVSSLGTGLRVPLSHDWSLTSILRLGAGGSLDLCTSGDFFSAGVTSAYNLKIGQFVATLTNYAAYFTTANLWLTGVNFNYHLQNYVFKNGLSLTTCEGFTVCERPINFSLSFIDSRFTREHLYIRYYDEVGISLIALHINPRLCYDCATLGVSYRFGQKSYKGYSLNFLYQF